MKTLVTVLAALLACGALAQETTKPTTTGAVYVWTQQACQQELGCKTVIGGSVEGLASHLYGGFSPFLRADISGFPERGLSLKDINTWNTVEVYGGAYYDLGHGDLHFGPAAIVGGIASLEATTDARVSDGGIPITAAGGARVGWRGGYLYVLVGKHEAAGPGTRVIASLKSPATRGFALRLDAAGGSGQFIRYGLVYQVPGGGAKEE